MCPEAALRAAGFQAMLQSISHTLLEGNINNGPDRPLLHTLYTTFL
jgi:hypothetical protein